jgi:hypothetical protein
MLAWWQDRAGRETIARVQDEQGPSWDNYSQTLMQLVAALDAYTCEDWEGIVNRIGRTFQQAGYPFAEASNVLVDALNDVRKRGKVARLVRNVAALVQKAEEKTAYYRGQQRFHGANSFGLFKKIIHVEVRRLKERP